MRNRALDPARLAFVSRSHLAERRLLLVRANGRATIKGFEIVEPRSPAGKRPLPYAGASELHDAMYGVPKE